MTHYIVVTPFFATTLLAHSCAKSIASLILLFLTMFTTNAAKKVSPAPDKSLASTFLGGGYKSLSAELTQVQVDTPGSGSFDSGTVNILYF